MMYSLSNEMCFYVPLIEARPDEPFGRGVGGGKNISESKQTLFGYKRLFISIQIRNDETIPLPYPPCQPARQAPTVDINVLANILFFN